MELKIAEGLKVLPFLHPDQPIDLDKIALQSKMNRQKVNQAIQLLSKSAIISTPHQRFQLHVQRMNGETFSKKKKEKN